jgi:chromate transport protein ChrA
MVQGRHLDWAGTRVAILECAMLGLASVAAYRVVTHLLSRVYFVSKADDLVGGLWAVLATIFVCRDTYTGSVSAAVSRVAATSVSFVLCLIYLIFLPFHAWALALLIGLSALSASPSPGGPARHPSPPRDHSPMASG